MTEQIYPKLQNPGDLRSQGAEGQVNYMMDILKRLREKQTHYKKIKGKWSVANTVLKVTGISVSCILAGASILTVAPFSIPVAAAILGGISIGNISLSNLLIEGFTSKRKRYFQQKHDHIKNYLSKFEILFIKCKEDGQVSLAEFQMFQRLLKDYENEIHMSVGVKSKDIKKAEQLAKKEIRQRNVNQLFQNILQDQQQKLN